jgi:hypothetical protein
VAFTGHGKNRKRLPGGGDVVDDQTEEPASKRARVATPGTGGSASLGSGSTTTTVDQDYSGVGRSSEEHQESNQISLEWISRELFNDDLQQNSFPSSVDVNYFSEEFAQAAAPTSEQQAVPEHIMATPLPMVQETAGMEELREFMASMDRQEFIAPLPMVQETNGMAEPQESMAPMDQQETAGMAELENPYQPMMAEFFPPMGVTLDESCGLSHISDMEPGAQQDFVEWDGFLFY